MSDACPFGKIAIVGLGVMGGSLLLGLRKNGFTGTIITLADSKNSRDWAMSHGANQTVQHLNELSADTEFVIFAVPQSALQDLLAQIPAHKNQTTLWTDVSSTKKMLLDAVDRLLPGISYLSCHPMCGSEKTGHAGASSSLYDHKTVILTPHSTTAYAHIQKLGAFWKFMQARTLTMDPAMHDASVAWVSHLPHLVSAALVKAIAKGESDNPDLFTAAGTGLRDISRLAASNPKLWREIISDNQQPVLKTLRAMSDELDKLVHIIENLPSNKGLHLEHYLEDARKIHGLKKLERT